MTEDRFKQLAYLAIYGIMAMSLSVSVIFTIVGIIILCNDGPTKGTPYFITGLVASVGGAMIYYLYLRARWAERREQQQHGLMNPVVVVMGIPVHLPETNDRLDHTSFRRVGIPVAEPIQQKDRCAV